MPDTLPLIPTTVVGSYVQPDWLIDRQKFHSLAPPRVRAKEIWRIDEEYLEEAQDAATIAAIHDMEHAGLDIVTDGEIRRESYSNRFVSALAGVEVDRPGIVRGRSGRPLQVPRITGPIRRVHPVELRDVEFLRANTDRTIKITLPGPFTLTAQAVDEHYGDGEAVAMAFAEAVNHEVQDLFAAGADIVQLDEPWMQALPGDADRYAVPAINRALDGAAGMTAVHMCFGYAFSVKNKPAGYSFLPQLERCAADIISVECAEPHLDLNELKSLPSKKIMVGVLNLGDLEVETADTVAKRIRAALEILPAERMMAAPDCGMKYLPRDVAFGKLKALAAGTAIVRKELEG
jgi:5-methyltetrahydropteroyltriglutamate--homocysteine methyltransferase